MIINRIKSALFLLVLFVSLPNFIYAVTKPAPDSNIDNLSYVFYLYYDNGQLFADRDYEIKFDLVNEVFSPESPNEAVAYKGEIVNFKSEVVKTFKFDPQKGDVNFKSGKLMVRGPYVPNALSAKFYNNQNQPLVTMFISVASICNDDGFCDSVAGENEKTCANDCKKPRATPTPAVIQDDSSGFLGGFDLNTVLIYVVGGAGVAVLAWLGWKWWKKKRGESFMPPPSGGSPAPRPPMPPSSLGGGLPPLQ